MRKPTGDGELEVVDGRVAGETHVVLVGGQERFVDARHDVDFQFRLLSAPQSSTHSSVHHVVLVWNLSLPPENGKLEQVVVVCLELAVHGDL